VLVAGLAALVVVASVGGSMLPSAHDHDAVSAHH
jgi:hypothetical protein